MFARRIQACACYLDTDDVCQGSHLTDPDVKKRELSMSYSGFAFKCISLMSF